MRNNPRRRLIVGRLRKDATRYELVFRSIWATCDDPPNIGIAEAGQGFQLALLSRGGSRSGSETSRNHA
jgi:hypothetical protein